MATWLGRPHPEIVAAAARMPVGVVTTARRRVLDQVLAAAGVAPLVSFTIAAEDVTRTKPDPEGYRAALARLEGISPDEVLVYEDTPRGVAAAKAAGVRCVAVLGSAPLERLSEADEVIETLDAASVRRLLA